MKFKCLPETILNVNPTEPTPVVSWLLCTHIANDYLRLAITSCLDQSFQEFELIVIANGEHAEDIEISVKSWFPFDSRLRIFTTEIRHLIFSLNLGLHHARGDLIARMDGDDVASNFRLEKQVEYMRIHPEVAILGTAFEIINDQGIAQRTETNPTTNDSIRQSLFYGNPLCHPTIMFRKRIVLDAGGYLGGLHAEDYDLWSRLALNSLVVFHNLPDICLGYRVTGIGMARRSRWAYSTVSASQLRTFVLGFGFKWLLACIFTITKSLMRSKSVNSKKVT
jgi:glycosyltransferase involved in cell wall biosynthesis